MSDRFRNKVISQLADEISHLSGVGFEQFGYKVMPLVQPGGWTERGTTIDALTRVSPFTPRLVRPTRRV